MGLLVKCLFGLLCDRFWGSRSGVLADCIYLLGGQISTPPPSATAYRRPPKADAPVPGLPLARVSRLDCAERTLTQIASMRIARTGCGAGLLRDGRIYAFGITLCLDVVC
jgi:hypothetical protein